MPECYLASDIHAGTEGDMTAAHCSAKAGFRMLPAFLLSAVLFLDCAPGAAQSPGYAASSNVAPGHYACLEFRGNRPIEFGQYTGTRFSNEFDILDSGRYEYRGSRRQAGNYSFNASTGAITWTSGPFAPDPDGTKVDAVSTVRTADGKPAIILTFKIPKLGESREYCALVR